MAVKAERAFANFLSLPPPLSPVSLVTGAVGGAPSKTWGRCGFRCRCFRSRRGTTSRACLSEWVSGWLVVDMLMMLLFF